MEKKHMIVRVASQHIQNKESQLDQMVRVASMKYEAGLKEEMQTLFLKYIAAPLEKYRRKIFDQPIDDVIDDVIKGIAPEITEKIREHEVDQDFDQFRQGVQQRIFERRGGLFYSEPFDKDEFFLKGYAWGEENFDLVNTSGEVEIPTKTKKEIILESAKIHEGLVTERALTLAMKKAWDTINPVEILKHIGKILYKYGWKVDETQAWYIRWPKRLFQLATTALGVAIVELLEHYVLPAVVVAFTGNAAWWSLASLPLLEIILPIVVAIFKKSEGETQDEVDGHLDWFEDNFGDIDENLPKKASLLLGYDDIIWDI